MLWDRCSPDDDDDVISTAHDDVIITKPRFSASLIARTAVVIEVASSCHQVVIKMASRLDTIRYTRVRPRRARSRRPRKLFISGAHVQ